MIWYCVFAFPKDLTLWFKSNNIIIFWVLFPLIFQLETKYRPITFIYKQEFSSSIRHILVCDANNFSEHLYFPWYKNVWKSDKSCEPEKIWKFEKNLKIWNLKFKIGQVDPRDMLNNFCFHVYAQKSLIIGENRNDFFWPPRHPILLH